MIIVLGVLSSLAEGIGIGLFIPFLQELSKASGSVGGENWFVDKLHQVFVTVESDQRLILISICIFVSVLLKALLAFTNNVLFERLKANISHWLRSGIFEQLLTVSYRFLERTQSGRLLNILATETWRTTDALSLLVYAMVTLCTLSVYLLLLLLISWKLTLLVLSVMIMISLIVKLFTRRVGIIGKEVTRTNTAMTTRMIEGIEGMNVIRSFGRESYEKMRFDKTSNRLRKAFIKLGLVSEAVSPAYEILASALLVLILIFTIQNAENLTPLLVFVFILYRFQPKIMDLDGVRVRLGSLAAAVDEVLTLIDSGNKSYVGSGEVHYQGLKQGIYFDRVTYQYNPSEKPALQNVTIHIPVGKTTALIGPSGGGKSTLIKLILRFYDVTDGSINIDSTPLKSLNLQSWRSKIALVSQDVYIFNASVRDNIAYGRLSSTNEEIIMSAQKANAHDFICQLPDRYDTVVGDRGIRLSGGQQQRITLARAILRNPEILILDEATNALDSITEQVIQEALDSLSQNRTVIVIAHRLSTVKRADHVIVLQEGVIREQGGFEDLLKLDGLFTRLYNLQFNGIRIEDSR
jgi:subfamily B ATP-binding cassette protein MsbA